MGSTEPFDQEGEHLDTVRRLGGLRHRVSIFCFRTIGVSIRRTLRIFMPNSGR